MNDPYEVIERQKFDALSLLQSIYNDPSEAKSVRMKAAIEALPFEQPKLAVTASLNGEVFASQMEKAFRRSAKVIEHEPTRPKTIVPDRRFRRA
jgi:hypothetical protein